jgi:hypothetical protein
MNKQKKRKLLTKLVLCFLLIFLDVSSRRCIVKWRTDKRGKKKKRNGNSYKEDAQK